MTDLVGRQTPRVLLLGDTRVVGHHGSSSVVKVILDELEARGLAVMSAGAAGFNHEISTGRRIDCIVINAEGALHGRNPNALRIARTALQARRAGLPCFIINAVVDECHEDVVEGLVAATALFCRERRSLQRACGYGVHAILCPDLTFGLDMQAGMAWTPGDRIIVTDSTLASVNRDLHAFARRTKARFLPLRGRPEAPLFSSWKAFVRIAKFNARHTFGKLIPGPFAADRFGCAAPTIDAFLQELTEEVRIVITGRFHGVCLCMKLGVPFVAIRSNTYKVEGLLEDAGLAHKIIDLESLTGGREASAVLALGKWSANDAAQKDEYVIAAQGSIAACFDHIASSVGYSPARGF